MNLNRRCRASVLNNMDRNKRIDELLATLPWMLGDSEKGQVRHIINTLLKECDAYWEEGMNARIEEIENDRGHS